MASVGDTIGFAKALISNKDDTTLGFTAVGVQAGELLPVVQLAMQKGLSYMDVAELITALPTFNEGLTYLFNAVPLRTRNSRSHSARHRGTFHLFRATYIQEFTLDYNYL
ncbi:hypothetical protein LTR22_026487 [Elasticomyces elasticus]|nr:hypothetical protein LTR22_026487 [Elasticomyces elasticus]